jgi:hypothetical protein
MEQNLNWTGRGKIISLAASFILILPAVINFSESGAAAGWNIFLGLILFGAIVSNYAKATRIVFLIFVVCCIRIAADIFVHAQLANAGLDILVAALVGLAYLDLRQQKNQFEARLRRSDSA